MSVAADQKHFFLYRVANDLWQGWGKEGLANSKLYFPSSRAKLYFVHYLHEIGGKQALQLPEWGDIRKEVERISGLEIVDPLLLLPPLYQSYLRYSGVAISFENFYPLGRLLLRDFDQIDKYCVRAEDLFQSLRAHKDLNTQIDYLSETQRDFLSQFFQNVRRADSKATPLLQRFQELWEILLPLYTDLKEHIQTTCEGYEGAVMRQAVERLSLEPERLWIGEKNKRYAVVGLNALNRCEAFYFQALKAHYGNENTLFYWNYPAQLHSQQNTDAAYFIKQNIHALHLHDTLNSQEEKEIGQQKVYLLPATSVLAQAEVVHTELEKLSSEDLAHTALILSDEYLLMPILRSLPERVERVNITMGYPLRNTLVYSFLESILNWLTTRDTSQNLSSQEELQTLLRHPFLAVYIEKEKISLPVGTIIEEKRLPQEYFLKRWLTHLERDGLARFLTNIVVEVGQTLETDPTYCSDAKRATELQSIVAAHHALQNLEKMWERAKIQPTPKLYAYLLPQLFQDIKASFAGEPIGELQVMGFLETRCLDFQNVIVVSCNEGALPALSSTPSLISHSLAKAFGLPTLQERETMYNYYFRTLIARAQTVRLVYTQTEGSGRSKEPSRYVLQQRYERDSPLEAAPPAPAFQPRTNKRELTEIPKSAKTQEELSLFLANDKQTAQHALSPSALATYCECPLRFYFQYIAKIAEGAQPPRVELSEADFGSLIHDSLQDLYKTILNHQQKTNLPLKPNAFTIDNTTIASTTKSNYERLKELPQPSIDSSGIRSLECEIASNLISSVLVVDQQRANQEPFNIFALEKALEGSITISGNRRVRLQGRIDRMDQLLLPDGGTRYLIIDYKTGSFDPIFATYYDAQRLFAPLSRDRSYVLQVCFYCYLLAAQKDLAIDTADIIPGLWFVMQKEQAVPQIVKRIGTETHKIDSYAEIALPYTVALQNTLEELFNAEVPFSATQEETRCKNCPYQILCGRKVS